MSSVVEIEYENKKEIYELGKVARQAAGAVLLREKDAVILATVARDDKMVDEDFLPLTVNYIEKNYAGAKFPGGFIKRETKPSDFETLTSRITDRSLRPLFPKGYAYPTHIVIFVLSSDKEVDLQVMALNAASAALYISDIPVEKNVCGVRIGKKDGEFIVNPTNSELEESELDLYIAGTQDELLMIEMRALGNSKSMNELSNEETIEAIDKASAYIKDATDKVKEKLSPFKKEIVDLELKDDLDSKELLDFISANYDSEVKAAVSAMAKSERASELNVIAENISKTSQAIENFWSLDLVKKVLGGYKKGIVRDMIINDRVRADGRGLKEVRDISIETNILPSAHSSCLFTRGQTQALVTVTLGGPKDSQMYERITSKENMHENFMVHYSFPGFSVGEASPLRPPGRRELGHGNLAKRALAPSFVGDSSQTIRIASDILESNGSSSMATICGGSLALRAADIDVKKLVAGVAMGLVIEGDKYAILTDIMGLEDHDGDMDFKIAGTVDGITALQMDIKLGGIDKQTLTEALAQAQEGKEHILAIMEKASDEIVLNEKALPSTLSFELDASTFGAIIGKGGETIKGIIEKFLVGIDLDRDSGRVKVDGENKESIEAAKEHIIELSKQSRESRGGGRDKKPMPKFSEGQIFDAEVKRVVDFGAFVELPGGSDGLLHISKLSEERVNKVTDIVNVGDMVKIKVLAQKGHKVELGLIEKL